MVSPVLALFSAFLCHVAIAGRICPKPDDLPFATVVPLKTSYDPGEQIVYSCKPGYVSRGGMRRFTCPLTGMWPINTLRCVPRVCPFAGILENGIVRYTSFEYPKNISFACNPGFFLNGTSSSKCTEEGKWSPDIPACARITCPPPPVPKFALLKDYRPSAGNNSLYQDTVVFKCLPHFAMIGNDTVMCTEQGNWTRLPECLEVKCPFPPRPENGYVNYPAKPVLLYKDKATFGCHETYKLDGPEEAECTKTGTWSFLPTCRESCKLPVKKATVLYQGMRVKIQEQFKNGMMHGDKIHFYCKNKEKKCSYTVEAHCRDGTIEPRPAASPPHFPGSGGHGGTMKKSYSGVTRTSSGRLRRLADPTGPALKRSFEVEEIEPPNSTPPRRVQTPLLRATVASSSQKFQDLGVKNSEPAARLVDSLSQRSPKPSLRRVELAGAKAPEPMSRRTEISIDISSKQVESTASAAGPSRFGLKRAEVLGHKTPEPVPRRTEITIVKPQESVLRRVETPASKIPEGSAVPATDAAPKRVEIQVPKPAEAPNCPLPSQTLENSEAPMSQLQSRLEPRPSVAEVPYRNQEDSEVTPSCVGDMADNPRDAMLKQAPASRNEKAPMEFGYVGIDSILEQMRRKAMKQGFEFNIMVVGQSGLGKSTLINTLFKSKISRKSVQPTSEERIPKTIEIKSITHDIEEKGVRMKLTVIDTPGFGDHINNENCWQPIMKFINDQYEKYLQEEVNINRKKRIPDTRVHCCLYFIPATGHSLRPLDIEFMKRLSKVVNIVPVIAKADTLTLEERVYFKQRITADLLSNGIDVYPQKEFDEDAEDRLVNEKFREMIPFAVVGSDHEYQVNGKRILGRKTKWGTIEVENTTHCEFAYLRDLLIRTHMQNIKDITSNIHFEAYRVKRLNEGNSAMANGIEKEPEAQEM